MDTQRQSLANFNFTQKYASYDPNKKRRETWKESVERVMSMHRFHLQDYVEEISEELKLIQHAYENKWLLGSQRSLQFAGDAILSKHARSYNCTSCYVDHPRRFAQALYLLLCGTGVGYSVQDHHVAQLPSIIEQSRLLNLPTRLHRIEDSIEGWADALDHLIHAYMGLNDALPDFDYSLIRPKGATIHSCGGKAPGPYPLRVMLQHVEQVLSRKAGQSLLASDASDLMCIAADCVLAGGMRRAALLCLFSVDSCDPMMMSYKSQDHWWETHPYRARANISALVLRDDPQAAKYFEKIFTHTKQYGEPATIWADSTEITYNPCVEIAMCPTLVHNPQGEIVDLSLDLIHPQNRASYEEQGYTFKTAFQFCNLCEINIAAWHDFDKKQAIEVVKLATILGCIQASYTGTDDDYLNNSSTREILERESLLGVSLTGLASGPAWVRKADALSELSQIAVQTAADYWKKCGLKSSPARVCTVKPSGNAAVNLGCSSGVHFEHSRRFIRRVQVPKNSPVVQHYVTHNPQSSEESVWSQYQTDLCLAFAIEVHPDALVRESYSAVEFLDWVKTVQTHWVAQGVLRPNSVENLTHNVSNTCTVRANEWEEVAKVLVQGRKQYGGVSCLSMNGDYEYPQPPFQAIYAPADISTDDPHRDAKLQAYNYWQHLRQEAKEVDYTQLREEEDLTTPTQEWACQGGQCEWQI
jgi:ribonucleoside-triphosphate reductase (thioredoxin)